MHVDWEIMMHSLQWKDLKEEALRHKSMRKTVTVKHTSPKQWRDAPKTGLNENDVNPITRNPRSPTRQIIGPPESP